MWPGKGSSNLFINCAQVCIELKYVLGCLGHMKKGSTSPVKPRNAQQLRQWTNEWIQARNASQIGKSLEWSLIWLGGPVVSNGWQIPAGAGGHKEGQEGRRGQVVTWLFSSWFGVYCIKIWIPTWIERFAVFTACSCRETNALRLCSYTAP